MSWRQTGEVCGFVSELKLSCLIVCLGESCLREAEGADNDKIMLKQRDRHSRCKSLWACCSLLQCWS